MIWVMPAVQGAECWFYFSWFMVSNFGEYKDGEIGSDELNDIE